MSDVILVIKIDEAQKKMVDAIMELPPQVENDLISAIRHGKPFDSVLDKIKAELERRGGNDEKAFCKSLNESYKLGLREAIEIIDKYNEGGE